jgi:Tfp pilus assembly pilus retraction ATPase PilT
MTNDVVRILSAANARKASDIHLSVGRPPILRVNGELEDLPDAPNLDAESCRALIYSFLSEGQRARLEEELELDCSFSVPGLGRFRANVLFQRGAAECALREDPDVILIGEMRDLETISLALTAAETGHLCLSTLHTLDSVQSINRIIDVFPAHQQAQVRVQLAGALKGVISQTLLPRREGTGRIAARELMLVNAAVANLIREAKTHMITTTIETSGASGMFTLDRSLAALVQRGVVSFEDALARAQDPDRLTQACRKAGVAS